MLGEDLVLESPMFLSITLHPRYANKTPKTHWFPRVKFGRIKLWLLIETLRVGRHCLVSSPREDVITIMGQGNYH